MLQSSRARLRKYAAGNGNRATAPHGSYPEENRSSRAVRTPRYRPLLLSARFCAPLPCHPASSEPDSFREGERTLRRSEAAQRCGPITRRPASAECTAWQLFDSSLLPPCRSGGVISAKNQTAASKAFQFAGTQASLNRCPIQQGPLMPGHSVTDRAGNCGRFQKRPFFRQEHSSFQSPV